MNHMILVALLFLLLLFDMASTAYVVRRWGFEHETNPLFRYFFKKGSQRQQLIVDVTLTTLLMLLAYSAEDIAFLLALCFAVVGLNNAVVIGRLMWSDARAGRARPWQGG
jgi:hypothetical protein